MQVQNTRPEICRPQDATPLGLKICLLRRRLVPRVLTNAPTDSTRSVRSLRHPPHLPAPDGLLHLTTPQEVAQAERSILSTLHIFDRKGVRGMKEWRRARRPGHGEPGILPGVLGFQVIPISRRRSFKTTGDPLERVGCGDFLAPVQHPQAFALAVVLPS